MLEFLGQLQLESQQSLLEKVLLISMCGNALIAIVFLYLLPQRHRVHKGGLWLLLLSVGFIIPPIGIIGFAAATLVGIHLRHPASEHRFKHVEAPEFYVLNDSRRNRSTRKEKSVLGLQNMPTSVVSPVLRHLLSDPVDDVRMMAFGMLDSEEKKVTSRILDVLPRLKSAVTDRERFRYSRLLAELYWELVYSRIVLGDLRNHMLRQAHAHAKEALELVPDDAGLQFLAARILSELGLSDEAEGRLELAIQQGLSPHRVIPYLAERAYGRREFSGPRNLMHSIENAPVTPQLGQAVEYWCRQENMQIRDEGG